MAEEKTQREKRDGYGRREEDMSRVEEFALKADVLACVKRDELEKIIKDAVRDALESYQHKCIMELRSEDVGHMRDFVGAIKEVGDGSLSKAAVIVRENHKFVSALHKAATKIGWGVLIVTVSIMGGLGLLAAGVWKQTGGS